MHMHRYSPGPGPLQAPPAGHGLGALSSLEIFLCIQVCSCYVCTSYVMYICILYIYMYIYAYVYTNDYGGVAGLLSGCSETLLLAGLCLVRPQQSSGVSRAGRYGIHDTLRWGGLA